MAVDMADDCSCAIVRHIVWGALQNLGFSLAQSISQQLQDRQMIVVVVVVVVQGARANLSSRLECI